MAYSAHKLLNNTMYKSYKDLAFVIKKEGENLKIFQDAFRPDIMKQIKCLTKIEKAGFMQLQVIVGMSKFNANESRTNITFETDSHGITQKTFKTLRDLGYITDYEETYLKDSNLVIPKLAFGNEKIFNNKVQMFNIKFKLSNNEIDLNDEKIKRAFPIVFGKKGILATKAYGIIQNADGTLSIDYKAKQETNTNGTTKRKKQLYNYLKKGAPTYEKQYERAINFMNYEQKQGNIADISKDNIESERS